MTSAKPVVFSPLRRTGGVEALHQLARAIGAEIRYDWPPLFDYLARDYPARGTRVVVPEIWPQLANALHRNGCDVYFWHLGVRDTWPLVDKGIHHLACGRWVFDHCVEHGVEPQMLTDYIDPVFLQPFPEGWEVVRRKRCVRGVRSRSPMHPHATEALRGMSRIEMREAFWSSTVYFDDQGDVGMPGRDRMPREAALCGCYPIISNRGAGGCKEDVPYIQTYDRGDMDRVASEVLEHGVEAVDPVAFACYQEWIRGGETRFHEEVERIFGDRVVVAVPTMSVAGAARVKSLIKQLDAGTVRPDSVFVIDNGGNFSCDDVVASVEVDVYTPGRNIGVAGAWNAAMTRHPNASVIIANDDIEISANTVERFVAAAKASDAALIGCELDYGYPCFLVKPETCYAVGLFDEQFYPAYGEDNDYTRRLRVAGLKKEQCKVGVREPAPGATSREMNLDREALKRRAAIRYLAKWGGPPDAEVLTTPRTPDLVPIVYIATVPWRRPIVEEMLRTLAKDPPQTVHLFLDAYGDEPVPAAPPGLHVVYHENRGAPLGPGPRWYAASRAADDVLAIVIDDDMKIDPDYVTRTLAAWTRLKEPFSWGGGGLSWGMPGHYTRHSERDVRLFCMGAGTAAVPAKLLRGIDNDPDSRDFLGYMGHDEVFISWWLRGHRLWRPAGPPVAEDTVGTFDPRSQWAHRERLMPLERRMIARGWEVPDGDESADPTFRHTVVAQSQSHPEWKRKSWQK